MDDCVYSALFGAMSNEHRLNMIANNLANAGTAGYKRDEVGFRDVLMHYAHDSITDSRANMEAEPLWPEPSLLAKPRLSDQYVNFSQGGLSQTNNPLDVALSGEGFFKIQTAEGVLYTRNGNFTRSAEGALVDNHGNPVLGQGGPIELPANSTVFIDSAGNVSADGQQIGALDIVTFADLRGMEKVGANLLRQSDANQAEIPLDPGVEVPGAEGSGRLMGTVEQGYLESSNVEIVSEMVRMIDVQRTFEAYQKMMQSSQQLDQRCTSAHGKPA